MRKRISILLLSVLIVGVSNCKKKETSKEYEIADLVGVWELSSAKLYDREAKFLTETSPKDEYGCGYITWTYTTDKIDILTYVGKDENGNCLEELVRLNYTLQNNTIKTLDDLGMAEEMSITNLTPDELVFMTALPNPIPDRDNAIKYTEIRCKRVK